MSDYRPILSRRWRLGGSDRVYEAADHLMAVESRVVMQHYRRFRFSEIQCILVSGLPRRVAFWIIMACVIAGLAVLAATTPGGARWFWGICAALAALPLAYDILRGPRCRCSIVTAAGKTELHAVARMSAARKFLATVRPRIDEAQESIREAAELARAQAASQPPPLPAPPPLPEPASSHAKLFLGFFAAAMADGLIGLWGAFRTLSPAMGAVVFYLPVLVAVLGGFLTVVARGAGSTLSRILAAVLVLLSVATSGYVAFAFFATIIDAAEKKQRPPAPGQAMLMSRRNAVALNGAEIALGTAGLIVTLAGMRRKRA